MTSTKKMDENLLGEYIKNLFKNTDSKERVFKGYRGCITKGLISTDDFFHCGDINCTSCNTMEKAIENAIQRATFKFYDNGK